jgi:hypothetical protein
METDPVSETLCFLVSRIPDVGQVQNPSNPEYYNNHIPHFKDGVCQFLVAAGKCLLSHCLTSTGTTQTLRRYYTDRIENDVPNNSSIFKCVFFAAVKFLPSRCLETKSGYTYTHRLMEGIYEANR